MGEPRLPRRRSRRLRDTRVREEEENAAAKAVHHHHVYVVLLDPRVAEHPSVRRQNPRRDPAQPCVYVGMTGLDPAARFANHRAGVKSAWTVKRYGVRLLPELYEVFNPMPFHAAVEMEAGLAEDLRAAGYTVTGGH